ncbi:MAG: nitrile hydratase subunit beta [Acidobacteria bacterium]|nr:nitrile hydratase subunit beta [Acidobacteriota bacterium]MYJ03531.1 nitrile hydratase subunit beta [Acidobacteriota bacterium]
MNGIHDMGGMDGMGSVAREENEPVFHEPWEGRVYGLGRAIGRWGRGRNWGSFRFALESLPPADYLRMSYYERWFTVHVNRLLSSDLVTREELDSGYADPDAAPPEELPASEAEAASPGSGLLDTAVNARFNVDDPVRGRNMHPRGHTRMPRYTRGRRGVVIRDNGVYALQDTDEQGQRLGNTPQHVYTVRFDAQELWGDRATARDSVYVDLWEEYLEPA